MQTPFKSTKHKSWKQKLQELKDIATGRKTIESIVEASRPKRFVSVMEENGIYTIEGKQLNQEQFDEWRESQKGNIISIIMYRCSSLNEPIIDEETHYPEGVIWKESKYQHTEETKEAKEIEQSFYHQHLIFPLICSLLHSSSL